MLDAYSLVANDDAAAAKIKELELELAHVQAKYDALRAKNWLSEVYFSSKARSLEPFEALAYQATENEFSQLSPEDLFNLIRAQGAEAQRYRIAMRLSEVWGRAVPVESENQFIAILSASHEPSDAQAHSLKLMWHHATGKWPTHEPNPEDLFNQIRAQSAEDQRYRIASALSDVWADSTDACLTSEEKFLELLRAARFEPPRKGSGAAKFNAIVEIFGGDPRKLRSQDKAEQWARNKAFSNVEIPKTGAEWITRVTQVLDVLAPELWEECPFPELRRKRIGSSICETLGDVQIETALDMCSEIEKLAQYLPENKTLADLGQAALSLINRIEAFPETSFSTRSEINSQVEAEISSYYSLVQDWATDLPEKLICAHFRTLKIHQGHSSDVWELDPGLKFDLQGAYQEVLEKMPRR